MAAGEMQRQRAPAAADLEHAGVGGQRLEIEQGGDALELGGLRFLERLGRIAVERARVDQLGVEPQPVEVVAEVVVEGDVLAAAAAGVGAQDVERAAQPARRTRGLERVAPARFVADAELEQRGEIGRRPVAVAIRLGQADVAAGARRRRLRQRRTVIAACGPGCGPRPTRRWPWGSAISSEPQARSPSSCASSRRSGQASSAPTDRPEDARQSASRSDSVAAVATGWLAFMALAS